MFQTIKKHASIKPALVALLLLSLIAITVLSKRVNALQDTPAAAIPVRVAQVDNAEFDRRVVLSGVTRGANSANLSFQLSGRALEQVAEVGMQVEQGQVLATLSNLDAQPSADSARERARLAQVQLDLAQQDLERFKALFSDQAITKQEFYQVKARYDAAVAEHSAAVANSRAFAQRLEELMLVAPFDGVITAVKFSQGDVIQPGQVVMTIVDPSKIEVEIAVSPTTLAGINEGDVVLARTVLSHPIQELTGRVTRKSPYTEQASLPQLIIEFDADDVDPGVALEIDILLPQEAVLRVPLSAIIRIDDSSSGVYVVDDRRANLRKVVPHYLSGNKVVVEGALSASDVVVVEGVAKLFDAAIVEVL